MRGGAGRQESERETLTGVWVPHACSEKARRGERARLQQQQPLKEGKGINSSSRSGERVACDRKLLSRRPFAAVPHPPVADSSRSKGRSPHTRGRECVIQSASKARRRTMTPEEKDWIPLSAVAASF